MNLPENLRAKLQLREQSSSKRAIVPKSYKIDFTSNDYLGLAQSKAIFNAVHEYMQSKECFLNGATGSRLLSGNHQIFEVLEKMLCDFHNCESALVFNSGYDANLGFFSSVPQKDDIILFDELVHASIREGILLSNAKSYKFKHNDLNSLESLFLRFSERSASIYIATESVFSMDGSRAKLKEIADFSLKNSCYLIVDEAHALGVYGWGGCGLVQELGLEKEVFARTVTFGKAIGGHGAAILCHSSLQCYLVNFARSFIYTTALPPHSIATVLFGYREMKESKLSELLAAKISFFKSETTRLNLTNGFIESDSAIQSYIIPGNSESKKIASQLACQGFDVKSILSPTVEAGKERLRFCIHIYNSHQEISTVLELLSKFVAS